MPILTGIEEKYFEGYKVDKENENTIYSDEQHVYIDKASKQKCISVTTLIGKYENEFDEDFWSSYKTLEEMMDGDVWSIVREALLNKKVFNTKLLDKYNINKDSFNKRKSEIIESYRINRETSCARGTAIHAMFENAMYGNKHFDFNKYGYDELSGEYTCTKDYYKLDVERGVFPEFLISLTSRDNILRVAGQVDLIIKDGNDIYIIDYKSNKKIKKTSYYDKGKKSNIMMKYPLNHIQDCNFNHYQLQLSLYAYLIQQIYPEYNIKGLKLIHIDHDNNQTEIECEYLKEDVERMLKHFKKQLKIQNELDQIKQIKY